MARPINQLEDIYQSGQPIEPDALERVFRSGPSAKIDKLQGFTKAVAAVNFFGKIRLQANVLTKGKQAHIDVQPVVLRKATEPEEYIQSTPAAADAENAAPSKCPVTRTIKAVQTFFNKINVLNPFQSSHQVDSVAVTIFPAQHKPPILDVPAADPEGSLFDGQMALTYSCYTGLVKTDESITRTEAPLYVIPEGIIFPEKDLPHPEPVVQFFHDQFRSLAMHKMFPCIGARTSLHHGMYRFGLYPAMGSMEAAAGNGRDLRRFVKEHLEFGDFTTFIAVFRGPTITSEEEYEAFLWKHLQMLHDHDEPEWDPDYAYNPEHDEFSFSFAKRSFFIVGLNPVASRISRNFIYPAIAFNPEHQIAKLRTQGKLEKWEHDIRNNDIRLQGSINPSIVTELGKRVPEARVYSGKANPPDKPWQCPFKMRPDVKDPKADS